MHLIKGRYPQKMVCSLQFSINHVAALLLTHTSQLITHASTPYFGLLAYKHRQPLRGKEGLKLGLSAPSTVSTSLITGTWISTIQVQSEKDAARSSTCRLLH